MPGAGLMQCDIASVVCCVVYEVGLYFYVCVLMSDMICCDV